MAHNSAAQKFKKKKPKLMSEFDITTSAAAGLEPSVSGLSVPSFGVSDSPSESSVIEDSGNEYSPTEDFPDIYYHDPPEESPENV